MIYARLPSIPPPNISLEKLVSIDLEQQCQNAVNAGKIDDDEDLKELIKSMSVFIYQSPAQD